MMMKPSLICVAVYWISVSSTNLKHSMKFFVQPFMLVCVYTVNNQISNSGGPLHDFRYPNCLQLILNMWLCFVTNGYVNFIINVCLCFVLSQRCVSSCVLHKVLLVQVEKVALVPLGSVVQLSRLEYRCLLSAAVQRSCMTDFKF